jgi:hypothetical protein
MLSYFLWEARCDGKRAHILFYFWAVCGGVVQRGTVGFRWVIRTHTHNHTHTHINQITPLVTNLSTRTHTHAHTGTHTHTQFLLGGDASQWDRALQMPHYSVEDMPALSLQQGEEAPPHPTPHMHTCTHTRTHMHMRTHMQTHAHSCTHTRTHMHAASG